MNINYFYFQHVQTKPCSKDDQQNYQMKLTEEQIPPQNDPYPYVEGDQRTNFIKFVNNSGPLAKQECLTKDANELLGTECDNTTSSDRKHSYEDTEDDQKTIVLNSVNNSSPLTKQERFTKDANELLAAESDNTTSSDRKHNHEDAKDDQTTNFIKSVNNSNPLERQERFTRDANELPGAECDNTTSSDRKYSYEDTERFSLEKPSEATFKNVAKCKQRKTKNKKLQVGGDNRPRYNTNGDVEEFYRQMVEIPYALLNEDDEIYLVDEREYVELTDRGTLTDFTETDVSQNISSPRSVDGNLQSYDHSITSLVTRQQVDAGTGSELLIEGDPKCSAGVATELYTVSTATSISEVNIFKRTLPGSNHHIVESKNLRQVTKKLNKGSSKVPPTILGRFLDRENKIHDDLDESMHHRANENKRNSFEGYERASGIDQVGTSQLTVTQCVASQLATEPSTMVQKFEEVSSRGKETNIDATDGVTSIHKNTKVNRDDLAAVRDSVELFDKYNNEQVRETTETEKKNEQCDNMHLKQFDETRVVNRSRIGNVNKITIFQASEPEIGNVLNRVNESREGDKTSRYLYTEHDSFKMSEQSETHVNSLKLGGERVPVRTVADQIVDNISGSKEEKKTFSSNKNVTYQQQESKADSTDVTSNRHELKTVSTDNHQVMGRARHITLHSATEINLNKIKVDFDEVNARCLYVDHVPDLGVPQLTENKIKTKSIVESRDQKINRVTTQEEARVHSSTYSLTDGGKTEAVSCNVPERGRCSSRNNLIGPSDREHNRPRTSSANVEQTVDSSTSYDYFQQPNENACNGDNDFKVKERVDEKQERVTKRARGLNTGRDRSSSGNGDHGKLLNSVYGMLFTVVFVGLNFYYTC